MIIYSSKSGIKADLCQIEGTKNPRHLRFLRGGSYIKQMGQGVFSFDFMGVLVLNKIKNLLREIFVSNGGREMVFPIVQEKKIWERSGRLYKYGQSIAEADEGLIVSPTHEEIATSMIGDHISYKDLPLLIFNIGHCFRKETRPKNGLLRSREFILFDGYAFSQDQKQHDEMYELVRDCFVEFLQRSEIVFDTAYFKTDDEEKLSEEFVARTQDIGEKRILHCNQCGKNYRSHHFKSCSCGGKSKLLKGIEFADIIRNGKSYAMNNDLGYIDSTNRKRPYYMLSFGLGISKFMASLIESSRSEEVFFWPEVISPFNLSVIPHKNCKEVLEEKIRSLAHCYQDILVDDRDLSLGRRVKEVRALGIPNILILNHDKEEYLKANE